ncbi:MAG: NADPH:quinone oxidoreductase family protein [Pseudomonadota bacterium]
MRAMTCHQWGAIESLVLESDRPRPEPGDDEVLIDVRATAVNYADSIMVAGNYQTKPPFPFSPGLETAGRVRAIGRAVTNVKVGDRVMAILAYGGFAEQAIAKAQETYPLPENMSWREAAAFPIAYLSSDVALRWLARLEPNETLLVLGAAGGVGLTSVEIGKAMGAKVIAAASTPEKLAAAESRRADALINYQVEDLKARVNEITAGAGADVCFDPVGGELFNPALSSLGWGGRMLLIGFVGGIPNIPANRLLVKNRAAFGSSLRHFRWNEPDKLRRSVHALLDWYNDGKLKPLVTHEVPLERAVDALRLLTERRAHGRVLVVVSDLDD